ncbi:glycosyltransferase family 39 protein [Candidatus Microgenomates bacterium]|nr:glycosyltransferase family 39 protein [Candidatus Microgenomates bacterium]
MKKERKKHNVLLNILLLGVIVLSAIILRWQNITAPLADFHSWRQADTAAVARNYVRDGIDLFHPKYDDLSNIQSGTDNPQGLRMVEFPLYNAVIAMFAHIPGLSVEVAGRIVTILSSVVVIVVIYLLCLEESGIITAVAAGLLYAIFPFFVYFSRVVLPESSALACTFLGVFFLYLNKYPQRKGIRILFYILAAFLFACGILIKPTVIFYALVFGWLFIRQYEWDLLKKWPVYLFFILAFIPFILWRRYILQFPEAIPVSDWLLTSVNTTGGMQPIFLKPSFFRWIFYERINNIIFGGYMTVFFVLGILRKPKSIFLMSIVASAITFIFVFEGGNVQHEYYQTIIFPGLAVAVGLGVSFIAENYVAFLNPFATGFAILLLTAFSYFISYYHVKGYYGYSADLVNIASIIKTVTQPGDKIVTDSVGDTTLLYLSDRRGSPAPYKDMEEFKKDGYKYFITMNGDVIKAKKIEHKYPLKFENSKFAIFEL